MTDTIVTTAEPRVSMYDHFTVTSVDLMYDLEFYEELFGARVLPRTVGRHRQVGERPAYINFSVRAQKKNLPQIIFMRAAGSVWGLFLQPDFPPEPNRMLQGARNGMAIPAEKFESALVTLKELD